MTQIVKHNPDTLPDAAGMGYTQVTTAQAGEMIFMSGQVAWRRDGSPVPDALSDQAKIAADNVRMGLEAVGAGPANITAMRIYVVGLTAQNSAEAAAPLADLFGGQAPCVTMIGVSSLALPELKIEMEVTAVK
jgi:enamine deaminase RidA (YjgF/YER057c/UK114 family)